MAASAIVTAGLRCAPLMELTRYTATATASAQPAVMTIQPLFWPLVLFRTTLATTPSPSVIRIMVPMISARKMDKGAGVEVEAASWVTTQRATKQATLPQKIEF